MLRFDWILDLEYASQSNAVMWTGGQPSELWKSGSEEFIDFHSQCPREIFCEGLVFFWIEA